MSANNTQNNIVERLFTSFTELETAIHSAKNTLKSKESVPSEIIERLDSYDGILAKQRALAFTLCHHMEAGEWDEVNRHVSLINGLSAMIRDDARSILSSLSMNTEAREEEDINIC